MSLIAILAAQALHVHQSTQQLHYAVGARIIPQLGVVAVDVIIALPRARLGDSAEFLLGKSYDVRSVDAGSQNDISIEATEKPFPGLQKISVRFKQDVSAPLIRLTYVGRLNPTGDPPLNQITEQLTELSLDSMWLPIRADFGARFTVDARIAGIPEKDVVVAQGLIRKSGEEVRITRQVPDFDLAFAAATGLRTVEAPGFELLAQNPASSRGQLYLKHGPAAIKFLEDWFGPMPAKPARVVVIPRPRSSGYARKGYIVLTEQAKGSEAGTAKFTAHEFAHAWFSNANPTTEHRWLDEAIAEYVSVRYVEHALGVGESELIFRAKEKSASKAKSVLGLNRSDAELYHKGALKLRALEQRLGRSKYDAFLATVARQRISETQPFLIALGKVADQQLATWFKGELEH